MNTNITTCKIFVNVKYIMYLIKYFLYNIIKKIKFIFFFFFFFFFDSFDVGMKYDLDMLLTLFEIFSLLFLQGYTPLHIAALQGHRHIFNLLVRTYGKHSYLTMTLFSPILFYF